MPPPDKPVDLEGTFSGIHLISIILFEHEDVEQQLQPLKKEIDAESVTLDKDIIALKETVRSDLKIQVIDALRDRIQSQVRLEVASQVKAQFDVQIRNYIPISLAEQVEQNKAQIEKVKCSRMNSEARRDNSSIQDTDLDEPFEVVLMENGERSDVWPADLRSLFAYEEDTLKKLLDDYNLPQDPSMEVSTNRFLSHIGITSWRLLRSPLTGA